MAAAINAKLKSGNTNVHHSTISFTLPISCQICLGKVKEPVVCPNQHVFCRVCMDVWLLRSQHCPTCRVSISKDEPYKPIIGGLNQQTEEAQTFSNKDLRQARTQILFKEYEDAIERVEMEVINLRRKNEELEQQLRERPVMPTHQQKTTQLDPMAVMSLSQKLSDATVLYEGAKADVKKLKRATKSVSGRDTTLGSVLQIIDLLVAEVEEVPCSGVGTTRQALLAEIRRRTSSWGNHPEVIVATLLNPRCKDIGLTDQQITLGKQLVVQQISQLCRAEEASDTDRPHQDDVLEPPENAMLHDQNANFKHETNHLRSELVSRSPRKFGRFTVATLESKLARYTREVSQLQSALERSDAHIAEMNTEIAQLRAAVTLQRCSACHNTLLTDNTASNYAENAAQLGTRTDNLVDSHLETIDLDAESAVELEDTIMKEEADVSFRFEMPSPRIQKHVISNTNASNEISNTTFKKNLHFSTKETHLMTNDEAVASTQSDINCSERKRQRHIQLNQSVDCDVDDCLKLLDAAERRQVDTVVGPSYCNGQ